MFVEFVFGRGGYFLFFELVVVMFFMYSLILVGKGFGYYVKVVFLIVIMFCFKVNMRVVLIIKLMEFYLLEVFIVLILNEKYLLVVFVLFRWFKYRIEFMCEMFYVLLELFYMLLVCVC